MKHFNNSPDGNVNLSNIHEFEPDYSPRPKKTEEFFVILLIIVGFLGAIYTFNFGFTSSLSKATCKITKNMSSPVLQAGIPTVAYQENTSNKIVTETQQVIKTQVRIVGEKEVNQKMKFTIESFDKKAKYDLIMGDGEILHPNYKTIEYEYKKPGNYHVQLKVNYNGESKSIFSEDIEILETIAIAPNAHREN